MINFSDICSILIWPISKKKILRPDYVPGAVLGLRITREKQVSLVFTRSGVRQTTENISAPN